MYIDDQMIVPKMRDIDIMYCRARLVRGCTNNEYIVHVVFQYFKTHTFAIETYDWWIFRICIVPDRQK